MQLHSLCTLVPCARTVRVTALSGAAAASRRATRHISDSAPSSTHATSWSYYCTNKSTTSVECRVTATTGTALHPHRLAHSHILPDWKCALACTTA